jgi:hypothetical protein
MQRKTQNTNVMAAIVSLLNSLQGKLKSTNFEKAIKEVNKIIDNPEKLSKFKELQNIADSLK